MVATAREAAEVGQGLDRHRRAALHDGAISQLTVSIGPPCGTGVVALDGLGEGVTGAEVLHARQRGNQNRRGAGHQRAVPHLTIDVVPPPIKATARGEREDVVPARPRDRDVGERRVFLWAVLAHQRTVAQLAVVIGAPGVYIARERPGYAEIPAAGDRGDVGDR